LSPLRRLILAIAILVGVFFVGTVGYMTIEEDPAPSFSDAAYMTAITLSTVGFGEMWKLSPAGRLWTLGIIAFGIGTVYFAFTALVTLFISGELREARGRKKLDETIAKMSNHVILCGYGRMGTLTVTDLRDRGMPVVVVELDKGREPDLLKAGVPYLMGDATEEDLLIRAGLKRATALVAILPHDADNVFITLTAHTLRPDLRVVARAEQPATEKKLKLAGADRVICPQIIGAMRITNLLTRPNVVDFVEMANKGIDLELDEYVIGDGSKLCGVSLKDSIVREKTGATVVAIMHEDGKTLFNPDPETMLRAHDTLIIIGPAGASERFDRLESGW